MYKDRLKELRDARNIKQKDVAEYLNMHRGSYSKYEIEDAIIPIEHLNSLCNYFDVSLDYILHFTDLLCYQNINKSFNVKNSCLRLKEVRKEFGMTQEELAKILGSAKTTISGYERGARIIATPFLYDICKKYKISADYLLGKIDEPKYLN